MQTYSFNNPNLISIDAISAKLTSAFPNLEVAYSNENSEPVGKENNTANIMVYGESIKAVLDETHPDTEQIVEYLKRFTFRNYLPVLTDFAKHFQQIEGVTIKVDNNSHVTLLIDGEPAAGLRMWYNSKKEPHEIEILPTQNDQGNIIKKFILENQQDILKLAIYVSGDLVRCVTRQF